MISAGTLWRSTPAAPGFAVVPAPEVDSRALRRRMLELARAVGAAAGVDFVPERFGRFDQQVSTRFHRDGAPERSLLVLGYEPSPVRSRLFAGDVFRAATDAGISVPEWLRRHPPLTAAGEAALAPYVTELTLPPGEAVVVLFNNSLHTGVLHKGVIPEPDPAARRVINSVGLFPRGTAPGRELPDEALRHFLSRDDLD